MFVLIETALGKSLARGEQHIWASRASKEVARTLQVKVGPPILVTVTTMFTQDGQSGGWRRAVHRADDFKYTFGLSR